MAQLSDYAARQLERKRPSELKPTERSRLREYRQEKEDDDDRDRRRRNNDDDD